MPINVYVNGSWKELGKDISDEEYESYCEAKDNEYQNKIAQKLGINAFHFQVLDLDRGVDYDTLILRFGYYNHLCAFVEEYDKVPHTSVKVLDEDLGLVKAIVF